VNISEDEEVEADALAAVTYPAHLSQLGQHNDDGGAVFPQHSPEVFGGQRQRRLSCYVRFAQSIALSHPAASSPHLFFQYPYPLQYIPTFSVHVYHATFINQFATAAYNKQQTKLDTGCARSSSK